VERGIPLRVVILPDRKALTDPGDPSRVVAGRMAAMAVSLDIEALDAWGHFADLVAASDESAWFLERPDGTPDNHFSAAGHREMARWLLERLGPGLEGHARPAGFDFPGSGR
jgi:lysophospholipase L1-like esterase